MEYSDVIVPAMPTTDVAVSKLSNSARLPLEVYDYTPHPHQPPHHVCSSRQVPLWKVGPVDGALLGFASGVRSGVIPVSGGRYVRLKGCGNNADGFVVAPVPGKESLRTLRGCAFEHTATRELVMTSLVNGLLASHGFQGANEPIG